MDHTVLNEYGKPYKLEDEVLVIQKSSPLFDAFGEVWKIRNYDNTPKISVIFNDGNVSSFKPEDLKSY